MAKKLSGKTVLVTGGSRGLGLALAREFARQGARLALAARDGEELERAKTALLKVGLAGPGDVLTIMADVAQREDAERMIAEATTHFGAVDVLVNNAGIICVGPVEAQTAENFEQAMQVNYLGMVYACLAVMPQMLARRGGQIVNIASVGGKMAVPHMLPYTASKFAAVGFSEGLHAELRAKGVRVTTVCPGLMRTGSAPQAKLVGDREAEYKWFSTAAETPVLACSAERAARRIVGAAMRGQAEVSVTLSSYAAARAVGLAPGLMQWVLSRVNEWILPQVK